VLSNLANYMEKTSAKVTLKTATDLGLTEAEFEQIKEVLGRTPNFTELSVYSVMWSEHCSYKNSIHWLKTLPREGSRLLVSAGEENAGLVDIGDNLACAFKIESHNHPSAIEPYQGAATGVGGIHRDIFTMGARPIAALNSLRFGEITRPHTRHLLRGVVSGIGDYGNCFGVPTLGGEVYFNKCYNQNILVNAMSVGIVEHGKTISATAEGLGNPVFIVGSATGKDGIHGATFASADLTEDSADDLPAVQVGDPFQEKLLLEASLEAIATGAVIGMQDMGAAGIACSSSEMSAKGGVGIALNLDKVPTRQAHMQAFEIMISESQERMLIVGKKGEEERLLEVFRKWDLVCEQIGEVTDTGRVIAHYLGEEVCNIPAESLVLGGGAPVYKRDYQRPAYMKDLQRFAIKKINLPTDIKDAARQVFRSANIVSKQWIYEQYDSMVRTNTISTNTPSDAAIVRVKGTQKALALTTDCNSAYVHADPYVGAMIAVAEASRNIVCSGGTPLAITNCLNFGNPYNPEVYYQFVQAIKGMGEACRKFDTPVTGGNVSFYNQSVFDNKTEPVFPTPTIGMMGLLDTIEDRMTLAFQQEGDLIYMLGTPYNDINSSEYLRVVHGVDTSPVPYFDLDEEYHVQSKLLELIKRGLLSSAHDVSEGGLFVSLMESAMPNGFGFEVEMDGNFRSDAYLFGESQGRIIVSMGPEREDDVVNYLNGQNVPFSRLGEVRGQQIKIDEQDFGRVAEWKALYDEQLGRQLEEQA